MSREIPLEITHLREHLQQNFMGQLSLRLLPMTPTSRWTKPPPPSPAWNTIQLAISAHVLSNRSSLWSFEPVFPNTADIRSRYRCGSARAWKPERGFKASAAAGC